MNGTAATTEPLDASGHDQLQLIRALARDEIAEVERVIVAQLDSDIDLVNTLGSYMVGHQGKLLRPTTAILSANAFGYAGDLHCKVGAILEMLHVATLLHDDVVDDSSMRRGKKTANILWGNASSVLVGDFIVSKAFELLSSIGDFRLFEVVTYTIRRVAEGEVMQLMNLKARDTDEPQYFDTIERKTAALFKAAAQLGAIIAHQPPEVEAQFAEFGNALGIAFQLRDDMLDYFGDAKVIGKEVGDDLSEGKMTLPLIRAYSVVNERKREIIRKAVQDGSAADTAEICEIVASSDALDYTSRLACEYSQFAMRKLECAPRSKYRDALHDLAEFAVSRDY